MFTQSINAAFKRGYSSALPDSYDKKMEKKVDFGGAFGALLTDFVNFINRL